MTLWKKPGLWIALVSIFLITNLFFDSRAKACEQEVLQHQVYWIIAENQKGVWQLYDAIDGVMATQGVDVASARKTNQLQLGVYANVSASSMSDVFKRRDTCNSESGYAVVFLYLALISNLIALLFFYKPGKELLDKMQ